MSNLIRVLILEASEENALLLFRELRRGGYEPFFKRVDRPEDMITALDNQVWDIVISGCDLASLSVYDALKLLKERGLDLPFIIVSDKIDNEFLTEAMLAGAHDYIETSNLVRFIPAIKRELREAGERLELRCAKYTLSEHSVTSAFDKTDRKEEESFNNAFLDLLKLFVQKSSRKDYLDAVVELLRDWSRCRCVGIRILDEEGSIPYEAFVGFSEEFWKSENWLSIKRDQCACIRVVTGEMEPQDAPFTTSAGSFRCDTTKMLVSELSEQNLARFRGKCIHIGFSSIAIIPVYCRDKIIGAIHLADEMQGKVPLKSVEFIESLTPLIGEAIHRFNLEEELQQNYKIQAVINLLLGLALKKISLEKILKQALNLVLSIPWISFESKGCIFLVEDEPEVLIIKAYSGFPENIDKDCTRVSFGRCLCGRAALTQEVQFANSSDEYCESICKGTIPHGHYCIPIFSTGKTLGVINILLRAGHRYKQKEVEFLISVANTLASVIMQKRMEEDLRVAKQKFLDIIEFLPAATFVINEDKKVIAWNRAMEEMTGVCKKDVLGKGNDIYSQGFYGDRVPMLIDLVSSDASDLETRYGKIERKGNAIYVECFVPAAYKGRGADLWAVATPLYDGSGNIVGAIESIRDITDRKKAEGALIEANKKAEQAERMALLGTMAAGIAHEINQPLNSLKIIIDGLLYLGNRGRTFTFEEIVEDLREVSAQINRVNRIVKRVRSFVKRKDSLELTSCDLNKVLEGALNMVGNQLSSAGIATKKSLGKLPLILGNDYWLEEVAVNLILNAVQALDRVNKNEKCISILTFVEGNDVILEVSDNATGVPEEIKNKVFEPFFTTKEAGEGMGLGLSIVSWIVTSCNGKIDVRTNEQGGATFRVQFTVLNN